eukprot:10174699-Ditylum_brightwellii.AAC.1
MAWCLGTADGMLLGSEDGLALREYCHKFSHISGCAKIKPQGQVLLKQRRQELDTTDGARLKVAGLKSTKLRGQVLLKQYTQLLGTKGGILLGLEDGHQSWHGAGWQYRHGALYTTWQSVEYCGRDSARQDLWHSVGHKGIRYGMMLGTEEGIAPRECHHNCITSQCLKVQRPVV